jgi:acetylglutamate kinase
MKKKNLIIVKIGGQVIDDKDSLKDFLKQFAEIKEDKILVHGGGRLATELSNKLNIPVKMQEGRRITDRETLDIATMVYAGLINKNIVAGLQSLNCNAIGLCGADGNCIKAEKRAVKEIDYGFAGDLGQESVNTIFLSELLNHCLVPVFNAITHDGGGNLLNTNADTIASTLAVSLSSIYEVKLVYCFEKNGVLRHANDDSSLISTINTKEYFHFKEQGIINGGMIPKLDNAFGALNNGVRTVHIGKAEQLSKLIKKEEYAGTILHN